MTEFFNNAIEFFNWISNLIMLAFDYFLSFISSLISGLGIMLNAIPWATTFIGYMPIILGSSMVAILAIAVIKFLLGR